MHPYSTPSSPHTIAVTLELAICCPVFQFHNTICWSWFSPTEINWLWRGENFCKISNNNNNSKNNNNNNNEKVNNIRRQRFRTRVNSSPSIVHPQTFPSSYPLTRRDGHMENGRTENKGDNHLSTRYPQSPSHYNTRWIQCFRFMYYFSVVIVETHSNYKKSKADTKLEKISSWNGMIRYVSSPHLSSGNESSTWREVKSGESILRWPNQMILLTSTTSIHHHWCTAISKMTPLFYLLSFTNPLGLPPWPYSFTLLFLQLFIPSDIE